MTETILLKDGYMTITPENNRFKVDVYYKKHKIERLMKTEYLEADDFKVLNEKIKKLTK